MIQANEVHPALRKFVEVGQQLGFEVDFDGTAPMWMWIEESDGGKAVLSHRGERQALPHSSSPLMAFGGPAISGQFFTSEVVEAFFNCGANGVIFERQI